MTTHALPATASFRRALGLVAVIALTAAALLLTPASSASAAGRTFAGFRLTGDGSGYLMVSTAGEFYAYGTAHPWPNPAGITPPMVAAGMTADGQGALAVSGAGQFYAYGSAHPWPNITGSSGIVSVAVTADGSGALAVSGTGQFYAYGSAHPWPNVTGSSGIVSVALTADGQGAVAMSDSGQFYAYGTAHAWLNPTGFTGRMTAVALTADGQGLVAVSSSGQFYAYGTAGPHPNVTGNTGDVVGLSLTADGRGLAALSASGQVYAYAPAQWHGNGDPGSAVSTDVRVLAQQIIDNPRIDKSGRLVLTDLQDAAAGRPATAGSALSAAVLRVVVALGQSHTLRISAIESGGTGHSAGSRHYTGDAVDLSTFDGTAVTGRNPVALTIIRLSSGLLPSGSRYGQSGCPLDRGTSMPALPAGIGQFSDTCNHLHVDVPRGTP